MQSGLNGIIAPTGIGNLRFRPAGRGAKTRIAQAKDRDTVSIKDFGAAGDTIIGVRGTNDTKAFAAALANMSGPNASLHIPAGTYTLDSGTLAKTLTIGQSLKIRGDGPDATILYFPNNGNGLTFTYLADAFAWISGNNVVLEDMTFVTNVQNTGAGVTINGASLIGDPNRPTIAARVGFRGTLANSSYWTIGFNVNDCQNFTWNDGYFFSHALGLVGTALTYNGSSNPAHPTVCNVQGLQMQFGDVGINCGGFVEGLNVDQCNFTQVNRGIHWDSNGGLPQCSVTNSQINAGVSAIDLVDCTAGQITGNLIFVSGSSTAIAGNPVYYTITGNTIIGLNAGAANGILLQSGATDNIIQGNVFKSLATNIWLQAGANNNVIGVNRYADGTPLLDQATGNLYAPRFEVGMGGSVTQATSKVTGVTLNKQCGQIVMNNANMIAGATVSFIFTNSFMTTNTVFLIENSSLVGTSAGYTVTFRKGNGSSIINVTNSTGGALAEAIVLNFALNGIVAS